jgi:hypothetical protein
MKIHSAPYSIITRALKCIVTDQGSMGLIADDGRPTPNEQSSGKSLCEASGDGAVAMSTSRDSTPVTEKAMESVSVEKQKAYSNACNGQTPHARPPRFATPSNRPVYREVAA